MGGGVPPRTVPRPGTGARAFVRSRVVTALLVALIAVLVSSCATGPWMPGHPPMSGEHMEGMMGGPAGGGVEELAEPVPGAPEIAVDAGDMWFDPEVIEIAAGEPVNITVTNQGGIFHDLVVVELGFRVDVDPGATVTGGIEVDRPGSYEFLCTVPGHAAAGMEGRLVAY